MNTSLTESAEILCQIADSKVKGVSAEILSGDPHDHNSFENKNAVFSKSFEGAEATEDGFKAVIPPCSVVKFLVERA